MKKFVSVLLVLITVISLSIPAFACPPTDVREEISTVNYLPQDHIFTSEDALMMRAPTNPPSNPAWFTDCRKYHSSKTSITDKGTLGGVNRTFKCTECGMSETLPWY